MKKRVLAVLLCVMMAAALLPTVAFAEPGETFVTDGFTYTVLAEPSDGENGRVELTEAPDSVTDVDLETVFYNGKSYDITVVGEHAFEYSQITTVSLPKVVTTKTASFMNCSKLEEVSLSAVTSLGDMTFSNAVLLDSVYMPNVTVLGEYAFSNCDALVEVEHNKVTAVKQGAFMNCTNLERATLPAATSIGYNAFSDCISLVAVSAIKAEVIFDSAFYSCTVLETIDIPAATDIRRLAFDSCESLESLYLPKVTSLNGYVFDGCTALERVIYGETKPSLTWDTYANANSSLVNYYTAGNTPWTGSDITGDSPNRSWANHSLLALGTVSVTNGSFAVSAASPLTGYVTEGTAVTVTANEAPAGQRFKKWTSGTALTYTSGSATDSSAVFTMPTVKVSIAAEYENLPATVTSVTVTPETASVLMGGSKAFSASVAGEYGPAETVDWTVEGNNSAATTISASGTLSVGSDETATSITVKATSTEDSTKSGSATVAVIKPTYPVTLPSGTGYTATAEGTSASPVEKGGDYSFKIVLDGNYKKGAAFAVKANGADLTPNENDIYTVSNIASEQIITVAGVVLKDADYTAVDAALAGIPSDLTPYTEATADAVNAARDAVVSGKNITEQETVNGYATAIENAVDALEYKPADYTAVDAALAGIPSDLTPYTEATADAVNAARDAVVRGKNITEQTTVNGYAAAIENAVDALENKQSAETGDTGSITLWIVLLIIAVGVIVVIGILQKRRRVK